jgi:hypothetical protein
VTPKSVELTIRRMHGGKPWITSYDNVFVRAAGRAIEQGFGASPVFCREGGSIPVVSTFQEELGVPAVLFGVGLPDENAHAPNERLDLGNFPRARDRGAIGRRIPPPRQRSTYKLDRWRTELKSIPDDLRSGSPQGGQQRPAATEFP